MSAITDVVGVPTVLPTISKVANVSAGLPSTVATSVPPPPEFVISGFTLDFTIFIVGSLFMLLMGAYLVIFLFGQPLKIANDARAAGSIVQHFDTPKSANLKIAKVSGDAFQYKDIRDGTVATMAHSVNNIKGRRLVLTYGNLGVTIPTKVLGAVSLLVNDGIKSFGELKNKYYVPKSAIIPGSQTVTNPSGQTISWKELGTDNVLVKGYDFMNFGTLIKQSKEDLLIPLTIEAIQNFVEKNTNASITEKKITLNKELYADEHQENPTAQFFIIGVIIIMLVLVSTVIK